MRSLTLLMLVFVTMALGAGCAPEETAPVEDSSTDVNTELSPSATHEEIMEHLYRAEMAQETTDALAKHFPDMSRERAYAIQKLRLEHREQSSERAGWKIGWSRVSGPEDELDPVTGHIMEDRVFPEDEPVSTRHFVEGSSGAEAEVVFYLNRDLQGPEVSREEVADAVESVGVAMEFVSSRLAQPHTRAHAIADDVYSAGVVLGSERHGLDEVDFTEEVGHVEVNGTLEAEGPATSIMGEDPFEALVWIANELPKWGWNLEAGDFVVTGTVLPPPTVEAGDTATVYFTNLGSVKVDFVE